MRSNLLALMGIRATWPYQSDGLKGQVSYQVSGCRFLPDCHQLYMLIAICGGGGVLKWRFGWLGTR
ncbi:hypothetical protein [Endozoicomonas sp. ALC020]|uniref:hypothetical protein n=1 Tax=unclassified Endozoicomonas TaxID=2644528 RepID=UPI003BB0257E